MPPPKVAEFAECDDNGEEIPNSGEQAKSAVKFTDKKSGVNGRVATAAQGKKKTRDAASDSGYSSRTTTTGSAESVKGAKKPAVARPEMKVRTTVSPDRRRSTVGPPEPKSAKVQSAKQPQNSKPPQSPRQPLSRNPSLRGRSTQPRSAQAPCDCDECNDNARRPRRPSQAPAPRHHPEVFPQYDTRSTTTPMGPPPVPVPRRNSSVSRVRPQSWVQQPGYSYIPPGQGPPPSTRGWDHLPVQSPRYGSTPPSAAAYFPPPGSTFDPRPTAGPRGYSDPRGYADDFGPSARQPVYAAPERSYRPEIPAVAVERGPDPRQAAAIETEDDYEYSDDYESDEYYEPRLQAQLTAPQANIKKTRPALPHAHTLPSPAKLLPKVPSPTRRDLVRTNSRSAKTTRSDSSAGRTKYTSGSGSTHSATAESDPTYNKRASQYGFERLAELQQKESRAKAALDKERRRMSSAFEKWQQDSEYSAEDHMNRTRGGTEQRVTAETLRAADRVNAPRDTRHLRAPSDMSSRSKTGSSGSRASRSHTIAGDGGLKVTVDAERGGFMIDFPEDYDGRSIYVASKGNKLAELTIGDRPANSSSTAGSQSNLQSRVGSNTGRRSTTTTTTNTEHLRRRQN